MKRTESFDLFSMRTLFLHPLWRTDIVASLRCRPNSISQWPDKLAISQVSSYFEFRDTSENRLPQVSQTEERPRPHRSQDSSARQTPCLGEQHTLSPVEIHLGRRVRSYPEYIEIVVRFCVAKHEGVSDRHVLLGIDRRKFGNSFSVSSDTRRQVSTLDS
jgi:hypothetical protein